MTPNPTDRDGLVERLLERASHARREGNCTAECDARMFEEAAAALREDARDSRRLDVLECDVSNHGALLLHHGQGKGSGFVGLGLSNTYRTLRQAIDDLDRAQPSGDGGGG